ncbi:MAG: metal-dependent hydrolase, partial [Chloroflexota bacterium]
PTEGIHRTTTHSVFFFVAVAVVFYFIGVWKKDARWNSLGLGLALGMALHSLLDFVIWFNGVEIFWPIGGEINFWANVTPPEWWMTLMDPAEFLMFGLYLWALGSWARKAGTDGEFMGKHRLWMWSQFALFIVFTPMFFLMEKKAYYTIYGALYLVSLFAVFFVTIRMRRTVEAAG